MGTYKIVLTEAWVPSGIATFLILADLFLPTGGPR